MHATYLFRNLKYTTSTSVLQLLLRWQYRLEKAAPSYFWGTNARRPAHSEDWDVCMIVVVATLALWSKFSNCAQKLLGILPSKSIKKLIQMNETLSKVQVFTNSNHKMSCIGILKIYFLYLQYLIIVGPFFDI